MDLESEGFHLCSAVIGHGRPTRSKSPVHLHGRGMVSGERASKVARS